MVLVLTVAALPALLVVPEDVWLSLGLFLPVLFHISVVTSH